MMRAAFLHGPGDLRVESVPVPEVGAEELLVRVEACGICPTDVRTLELSPIPSVLARPIGDE